ncbi:uncharacterized protein MKK02DRAFT_43941 [Dioszegia hungarica]|uniref:NOT2/NOT3/NOT5 C-terminal domain-containing protein n=1 Tax=Dioszegia hungarica TaxID=4972 RepID=A0AA38H6X0_9TREE|nr:uncharacterized protein MKK02DRAFT_43941 [Dioszegia hungarica]KAI9635260.1 hypothetical protein MKK02DRAFT_43941 [Dioszegia hungarica]
MYYATAGQQATQPTNQGATRGMSMGPAGFPPISGGGGGGLARGAPPGFASRTTDPNDFPALGTSLHPSHSSSYATQTQQPQSSPLNQGQHLPQSQQQMYHPGLAPPPGIPGPASQGGSGTNGMLEQLRGEEFPALGSEKDRMANYLRTGASSPPLLANGNNVNGNGNGNGNGASTHSASPSAQTHNPMPELWRQQQQQQQQQQQPQHSPNTAAMRHLHSEPVVRPVQQILSSPVDKWGLKALLYEIKTQMGKTDRGVLMFGEDLSDLGVDVTSDEPLYRTFVTPWQESNQIHSTRLQDMFNIPTHYQFPPPNMAPKMVNLSEDTLFIAFYASPQDTVQLDSAAELYNRGWRYHTELQLWLNGPSLANIDGTDPALANQSSPEWARGPFVYFDPRTLARDRMPDEFMINLNLIEATRQAAVVIGESRAARAAARGADGEREGEEERGQANGVQVGNGGQGFGR